MPNRLQRVGGQRFQTTVQVGLDSEAPVTASEIFNGVMVVQQLDTLQQGAVAGTGYSATAAKKPQIQLFNPAGSGVLCHVDRAEWRTSTIATGDVIFLAHYDTALTDSVTPKAYHRMARGTYAPACQLRGVNQASALGTQMASYKALVDDQDYTIPMAGMILEPGTGIILRMQTDQTQLTAHYYWNERPARRTT